MAFYVDKNIWIKNNVYFGAEQIEKNISIGISESNPTIKKMHRILGNKFGEWRLQNHEFIDTMKQYFDNLLLQREKCLSHGICMYYESNADIAEVKPKFCYAIKQRGKIYIIENKDAGMDYLKGYFNITPLFLGFIPYEVIVSGGEIFKVSFLETALESYRDIYGTHLSYTSTNTLCYAIMDGHINTNHDNFFEKLKLAKKIDKTAEEFGNQFVPFMDNVYIPYIYQNIEGWKFFTNDLSIAHSNMPTYYRETEDHTEKVRFEIATQYSKHSNKFIFSMDVVVTRKPANIQIADRYMEHYLSGIANDFKAGNLSFMNLSIVQISELAYSHRQHIQI